MKKLNKIPKEMPLVGFCIIRPDILKQKLKVPVGKLHIDNDDAIAYRWFKNDEGFNSIQLLIQGAWRGGNSIDFEYIYEEKEVIKAVFKNYHYSDAMEEIKDWSAAYLKQFLNSLGYKKPYIKDIMIGMVKDLARIHRWDEKLTYTNPFLVK